jgi:very-short-patch-repair endonuclease
MPPTNFFQRGEADSDFDGNVEGDLESILDECLAVGVPHHSLSWHYRSRHESLIAFSNHRYYNGGLITFPAAQTKESAVTWKRVNGAYAKVRARTNQDEAEAIVEEVVTRLLDPEFNRRGWTLGIITLNADQQQLIENLLDEARRKHPEIEPHFDEGRPEPVVVKNLETVQGDERDVILLGIGYGPKEPGIQTMSMNFGPLNRDGGERRLNVALTRSRREMVVFTSFDPSMIDLNRTGARAVRDLKHFLEFAERGPRALTEAVHGSMGGYESPFEEAVARRLQAKGWQVVPQVGVSRFRVDLGVVHPRRPGDFLVGVECDGATYHSAATARDRDKVRASVLEGLGWKLLRIWSTDWFVDGESELEKLDRKMRAMLEEEDEAECEKEESLDRGNDSETDMSEVAEMKLVANASAHQSATPQPQVPDEKKPSRSPVTSAGSCSYRVTDFSALGMDIVANRFHDDAYTETLRRMIRHVLETEAPIADDLLVTRIARAHSFKRSGRLIREKVMGLVEEDFILRDDPAGGAFVWLENPEKSPLNTVRTPNGDDPGRGVDQIPSEEIVAAGRHVSGEDPVVEIARLFGIQRLSAAGRERIEMALQTSS